MEAGSKKKMRATQETGDTPGKLKRRHEDCMGSAEELDGIACTSDLMPAAPSQTDSQTAEPAAAAEQQNEHRRRVKRKVLTQEKVERLRATAAQRGIVYISRIPPHMKPAKLRQLLEQYGVVGRVYCAPEDPSVRRLRKKKGGNTG